MDVALLMSWGTLSRVVWREIKNKSWTQNTTEGTREEEVEMIYATR